MTTPEGWYPHPDDELRLRFWDGTSFTDERIWDGSGWATVEATTDTVTPPPFDMERVTLTIVDDGMEPIPPDQLVPPPEPETEPVGVTSTPAPPADTTELPLPPPPGGAAVLPPPPVQTATLPPPPGRRGSRRTVWFIAAAVVVAASSAGATSLLVNRDTGEVDTATAEAAVDEPDQRNGDATDRSTTTSTTTTVRPTTTTAPTTIAPAGPVDSWVVVLASVENASGPAAAQQRLSEVRSFAPGAQMLASDGFASLRPGYQVIYVTGYSSPEATVSACRGFGLDVPNQCYGRFLSQNPADQDKVAMG